MKGGDNYQKCTYQFPGHKILTSGSTIKIRTDAWHLKVLLKNQNVGDSNMHAKPNWICCKFVLLHIANRRMKNKFPTRSYQILAWTYSNNVRVRGRGTLLWASILMFTTVTMSLTWHNVTDFWHIKVHASIIQNLWIEGILQHCNWLRIALSRIIQLCFVNPQSSSPII